MGVKILSSANSKHMPTNELNKTPYLEAIAKDLQDRIIANGYSTTGEAERSIKVRNNRNVIAKGYVSTLFQGVGRRPSNRMPPRQAIEPWVRMKGLQFTDRQSGRPMTVPQMSFVIARKIQKSGTRIFRDRRRGIRMQAIIEKNNNIYMPKITRDLKNTFVKEFNLTIVT